MPDTTRLNKYIALHTGISRREADELITSGAVMINGLPVQIGQQVSEKDTVEINGAPITLKTAYTYLMLHKPVNYVCSRKQQGDTPTIYSLLPPQYHALKPVGRLDKDSSGIILLTDDGDFAHRMTHPSFHKVKIYHVQLDKPLEPLHRQMISDYGLALEDGVSKFLVEKTDSGYQVTMHEGRNRQIRRTFTALGYTVTVLHRTQFGAFSLGSVPSGEWQLTDAV
jgi:23S rRNA pseudouridine2605 synthase